MDKDKIQMVSCGDCEAPLIITSAGTGMCSKCGSHAPLEEIMQQLKESNIPQIKALH